MKINHPCRWIYHTWSIWVCNLALIQFNMGSLTILYIIWSVCFVLFLLLGSFDIGDCDANSRSRISESFWFKENTAEICYNVYSSPVVLDTFMFPKREVNVLRARTTWDDSFEVNIFRHRNHHVVLDLVANIVVEHRSTTFITLCNLILYTPGNEPPSPFRAEKLMLFFSHLFWVL